MRCSKCGKRLSLFVKFCPKCGETVSQRQKKKALFQFLILLGVSLICTAVYFYFFYRKSGGASNPLNTKLNLTLGLILAFLFIFAVLSIIAGFVKFVIRRPIWGAVIAVLILSLAGGGYYIYRQHNTDSQFKNSLALIQDSLAEVGAAKIMGDTVIAKKTIPGFSMVRVQVSAQLIANRLEFMPVREELLDYRQSVIDWSNQIAVAAQIPEIWKDLPGQPRDFKLSLSDRQAKNLLQDSIKKITVIKEFGDDAIKRKDRTTMLYIAAKLMVQEHWLGNVLQSEKAGMFSLSATPLAKAASLGDGVPPVGQGVDVTCQVCSDPKVHWTPQLRSQYGCDTKCKPAQNQTQNQQQQNQQNKSNQNQSGQGTSGSTGQTPNKGNGSTDNQGNPNNNSNSNQNGNSSSANNPSMGNRKICIGRGGTATGPSNGSPTNVFCVEDAIQSTNEIEASAIGFASGAKGADTQWDEAWGHAEGGLGVISQGQPNSSGHTPTVQAFYDACSAKGGIVGGAGTVKTGLPTTESGYTCEYKSDTPKNGTQPCWDLLTYSGGRYMGGNTGCPIKDILPEVSEKPQSTADNWDGTYHTSGSASCGGDLVGKLGSVTLTASHGKVTDDTGISFPVNSNGIGAGSYQSSKIDARGNTMNSSVAIYFHFYKQGESYAVSYSLSMVATGLTPDGRVLSGSCAGSGGGGRQ